MGVISKKKDIIMNKLTFLLCLILCGCQSPINPALRVGAAILTAGGSEAAIAAQKYIEDKNHNRCIQWGYKEKSEGYGECMLRLTTKQDIIIKNNITK